MSCEPAFAPERLVAALNGARARYVIVDGLAVGAHGVVRATRDLDIVCAPALQNMDRVADCLTALGAEHPVQRILTGASLSRPISFKLHTRHGDVQVLNRLPGVPSFDELDAERIPVRISSDAVAPVCSLAHLRGDEARRRPPPRPGGSRRAGGAARRGLRAAALGGQAGHRASDRPLLGAGRDLAWRCPIRSRPPRL